MQAKGDELECGPGQIPADGPIRVLLADDSAGARKGVGALLHRDPRIRVVAEAASGATAVALARKVSPDVVIMDVRMPEMDGIAATKEIRASSPGTAILMLTFFDHGHYAIDAMDAGAAGFLLKVDADAETLSAAVHAAARGDRMLISPRSAHHLAREWSRRAAGSAAREEVVDALTPREREVLHEVVAGLTNEQIARRLRIEKSSVKGHIHRILAKTGNTTRVQLAVWALWGGLVLALLLSRVDQGLMSLAAVGASAP